ncbi:MAG: hypothetical protein PHS93_07675 [Candidatus Omnitrophica bacterium]|nr:hypothetical protein [Candidatus Omnitrophota bacterium]
MALVQKTAPTVEPITLAEVKEHLRLASTDFADDLISVQSIPPGAHGVAAAYALTGTGVDVLGYNALAEFECATVGVNASVTVKLQESDDNATWVDVTDGGFTRVTPSTDNATFEKSYAGGKQYLRGAATVATAACDFAVTVIKKTPTCAEDDLLNGLIKAARIMFENELGRSLMTQTWYYYRDSWPSGNSFDLPNPPVATITAVTYTDTDNTAATLDTDTYIKDIYSYKARIVLGYGETWPSTVLYPSNPIRVEYITGYGLSTTDVPELIRRMLLVQVAHMYENRDTGETDILPLVRRAISPYKVWNT